MAETRPPCPVKFFIAILYREQQFLKKALLALQERWGAIDFEGADHCFDVTHYYQSEMGAPLYRRIVTIGQLLEPTLLVEMKLHCNEFEQSLAHENQRTVNLDAGYLDHNKYLLASAKEAGQKVYLDKGIYADLAGRFKGGKYQPFEWSFPDFRDGRYDEELLTIRSIYLNQLKTWRKEQYKQ